MMKRLVIVLIVVMSGCKRTDDLRTFDAAAAESCNVCKQDGYGRQSSTALCAEIINTTCVMVKKCIEKEMPNVTVELRDCLMEGLLLCSEYYDNDIDPRLVYDECIPEMISMQCTAFDYTFPLACTEALREDVPDAGQIDALQGSVQ